MDLPKEGDFIRKIGPARWVSENIPGTHRIEDGETWELIDITGSSVIRARRLRDGGMYYGLGEWGRTFGPLPVMVR